MRIEPNRTAVLAAIALGFLIVGAIRIDRSSVFFTSDGALAHATAWSILGGDLPLAGPPAARGGRHPAPYYFYWEAALLILGLTSALGSAIAGALIKATAFAGTAIAATLLWEGRARVIALIAAAFILSSGTWYWIIAVPWHSNFMALLGAVLLIIMIRGTERPGETLPAFLFVANLAVLSHLAAAPYVAMLAMGLTVAAAISYRRGHFVRPSGSSMVLSFAGIVASWTPVIVYEIAYGGSHGALFGRRRGAPMGIVAGADVWSTSLAQYVGSEFLDPESPVAPFVPVIAVCGVLGVAAAVPRLNGSGRIAVLTAAGSIAAYLFAIASLRPPGEIHYLHIAAPAVLLVGVTAITALVAAVIDGFRERDDSFKLGAGVSSLALLFLVVGATGRSAILNLDALWFSRPWDEQQTLAHAQKIAALVEAAVPDRSQIELRLDPPVTGLADAVYALRGGPSLSRVRGARKMIEMAAFAPVESAEGRAVVTVRCRPGQAEIDCTVERSD